MEKRHETRRPPLNRRAVLRHPQGGEWPVELRELGFFGGLLHGNLPHRQERGWQLQLAEQPALALLPLRADSDGLAFVFVHSEAAASTALAALLRPAIAPTRSEPAQRLAS